MYYDESEMPLRANLLRYRLGEVQSATEVRALHDQAEQWIRAQGIVPRRHDGPVCMHLDSPRSPVIRSRQPTKA